MKDENKSLCWVDGDVCPYHSDLSCLKNSPINSCSHCVRYEQNKELIIDLIGDSIDSMFVSDEDIGIICSLLRILRKHEEYLSKDSVESLKRILKHYE
ncbi:hypothetical protein A2996_01845 [Candidatus Campbellbacteria bacterium RIFCSPLOWO2_01_FULL_34_15]|uniref:Uncharacterized protein n=2 Tax=Candidatus Campbelliibacteriota TaxID=1752727 RepID=A0A1F5EQG1_9BACT|nr:MAG: hypothetical protein A2811_00225 [Candidatus Campbellbacteria bacterium RIFCSPHIGHO2_01_FULL_34_10]OGD69424.1 MAG: hypothetical protein A2996_01845 [Candidatus Campbellbacteria bacterium RIFCSPLOWO2_01_FULL_34_15]